MKINIKYLVSNKKNIISKKKITEIIKLIEHYYNFFEINIIIINNKKMKFINKKYRKINKCTDILTFKYNLNKLKLTKKKKYIGEIILCKDFIIKNCIKYKKNIYNSWCHLLIHGCLHLIGITHNSYKKQKKMKILEENILEKKKIFNIH